MNQGKSILSQIMDFVPKHKFRQCVNRYGGIYRVRSFTCFDQFMGGNRGTRGRSWQIDI
jgi:hypothetical protein